VHLNYFPRFQGGFIITALVLSRAYWDYLLANLVGCSPSSTPLFGLYSVPGSSITWHHCSVNSIGFGFRSGSPSSCRASSSGLSTAQHLCTSPTASTAQLTSPRGGVCVPAHQRRSLFQWLVAARSGIALSRLLLPAHGTAYHRLSRYRRHCRLSSVIWKLICSLHRIGDAAFSCLLVFCLPNMLTILNLLRVLVTPRSTNLFKCFPHI